MSDRISHYCYAPHAAWPLWTRLGWAYDGELGPPHCFYSSLYVWRGEGEPVMPFASPTLPYSIDSEDAA